MVVERKLISGKKSKFGERQEKSRDRGHTHLSLNEPLGFSSTRSLQLFHRLRSHQLELSDSCSPTSMSFWREACQPLRRIASRATAGSERSYYVCQQSKRYMSNGNLKSTQQRLLSTPAGIAVREVHAPRVCSWHSVKQQARRQFSLTAGAQHGHITPPKPGEE